MGIVFKNLEYFRTYNKLISSSSQEVHRYNMTTTYITKNINKKKTIQIFCHNIEGKLNEKMQNNCQYMLNATKPEIILLVEIKTSLKE